AAENDRSFGGQPGEGNVVGGPAGTCGFLADTVFSVDDRWLFRVQSQNELKAGVDGPKFLLVASPVNPPVPVPDRGACLADPGDAWSGTIDALCVVERAATEIA